MVEDQFHMLREDVATMARLLKEIGESKAGEARETALAEATRLMERSRKALDEGRFRARRTVAPVEEYIHDKPVQSALIALGAGVLLGMMMRR